VERKPDVRGTQARLLWSKVKPWDDSQEGQAKAGQEGAPADEGTPSHDTKQKKP